MNWKGERVLVTGADGFIGSHLAERLVMEGARVRAMALYNSFGSRGWLDDAEDELLEEMDIVFGDVRDRGSVLRAVRGCSAVFHLAALISVPYSYEAPESYVATNVEGTLNVLEAARQLGGARVVHTSSSEVYGTPEDVPITEAHPLRAQSPYAASKIAADKLVESYFCSYEVPTVILRPFNTYGPRQSARAVVVAILTQLLAGRECVSLGTLSPRRDLTYVDDTVDGFVRAGLVDEAVGRTIQLGTGHDVSIGELADLAMEVTGRRVRVESVEERKRPDRSEVHRLLSDPSLARETLGWTAFTSLDEGLQRTAEWLERHLASYRPGEYMI